MTRLLASVVLLALLAATALAQQEYLSHEVTEYPLSGRYQIVQSQIARRYTFRLDRYTGEVDRYVEGIFGSLVWERMPTEKPEVEPDSPRFVIFLSGHVARDMFLIDTYSGLTWNIQRDTSNDDALTWTLVRDAGVWLTIQEVADLMDKPEEEEEQ